MLASPVGHTPPRSDQQGGIFELEYTLGGSGKLSWEELKVHLVLRIANQLKASASTSQSHGMEVRGNSRGWIMDERFSTVHRQNGCHWPTLVESRQLELPSWHMDAKDKRCKTAQVTWYIWHLNAFTKEACILFCLSISKIGPVIVELWIFSRSFGDAPLSPWWLVVCFSTDATSAVASRVFLAYYSLLPLEKNIWRSVDHCICVLLKC